MVDFLYGPLCSQVQLCIQRGCFHEDYEYLLQQAQISGYPDCGQEQPRVTWTWEHQDVRLPTMSLHNP